MTTVASIKGLTVEPTEITGWFRSINEPRFLINAKYTDRAPEVWAIFDNDGIIRPLDDKQKVRAIELGFVLKTDEEGMRVYQELIQIIRS